MYTENWPSVPESLDGGAALSDWHVLLAAEPAGANALHTCLPQGSLARRGVAWHTCDLTGLPAVVGSSGMFDAVILLEAAAGRPGLDWLRQAPPELPVLYLLPAPDEAAQAAAEQAGAFVLALDGWPAPGGLSTVLVSTLLRSALTQALHLGQARRGPDQASIAGVETVLGGIADARFCLAGDGTLLSVSPAAAALIFDNQPAERLVGRRFRDAAPDLAVGLLEVAQRAGSGGQPQHVEVELPADSRWLEVYVLPHVGRMFVFLRDISRRKQAELERERLMAALGHERVRLVYLVENLRASEELYRATFDNALVGIAHVSLKGEWLQVNDRLCQITGYRREELMKTSIRAITYPDDRPADAANLASMLRGEISGYQAEKRYLHKDGHPIWIHLSAALQRDEYDHPSYIISIIQDITDRKRLETNDHFLIELGDRLARAGSLAELVGLTVTGLGQHLQAGRCLVAELDPVREEYLVYDDYHTGQNSLRGRHPLVKQPPPVQADLAQRRQVAVHDVAGDERTRAYFDRLYGPMNARSFVHTPFVREEHWLGMLSVYDSAPRAWDAVDLRLLRSVADLLWLHMEKIRLVDNLRKSEERLRLALTSSGVTVFSQDSELRSTWVYNPHAGVEAAALLGLSEGHQMPPADAERLQDLKRQVMASGQQGRQEVQLDVNGQTRYYQLVVEPARDANGAVNGILASAVDLTDRRQAEEAIRQYAERLERSNRDLQDFAFIASHDLQEPLRKVRSFGRILADSVDETFSEEARSYLERMVSASERMHHMIDDLLAYSRVTTKGEQFTPVALGQVAVEVLADLELLIQQTSGQVSLGDLPEIEADRRQMQQLLLNLIGNGLKFHEPGRPPQVCVSARQGQPGLVELVVEDNGIGFEEQYLERIFQPFQRLHGRMEYEGSGIGLAICRKIAERHGGSITARSQPGQGSQFIVTLPGKH